MRRTGFAALTLATSVLVATGCGGSAKTASQSASSTPTSAASATSPPATPVGAPLTRAQLIAKGDAICYRLNARRQSTRIEHAKDYEHLIPSLAAYESQGANEMSQLVPPASMAHAWRSIVIGSHTIAEVTGRFHRYSEASNLKLSHQYDVLLGHAIDQVVHNAKHAGFKECSRFL
jgi:hypothetical protein